MKIVFRTDASLVIGSGHVMRCLALADALQKKNHEIVFICREYPGNLIDLIKGKKFKTYGLKFFDEQSYLNQEINNDYAKWLWVKDIKDADETSEILVQEKPDLLIVDHYGLDKNWEKIITNFVKYIMVIDDLANRNHICNILLDYNFYSNFKTRYKDKVIAKTNTLLGPDYVLLKPELKRIRQQRIDSGKFNNHEIKNILVYMGGVDRPDITTKIINVLTQLEENGLIFNILVGSLNPHKNKIKQLCNDQSMLFYDQPSRYYDLLATADLFIGGGGSTTYERCYLGIPSLAYILAENQKKLVLDSHDYGIQEHIENINKTSIVESIDRVKKNFEPTLLRMTSLIDGLGIDRVCQVIERITNARNYNETSSDARL